MFLIVGLGNPGEEYAGTRHNIGFDVLDDVGKKLGVTFRISPSKALVGDYVQHEERIILAKPQTFVNQSGESVKLLFDWFKITPSSLLVVHDELDIPFGEIRVKDDGSSGGHKGLDSIIKSIGHEDFKRIRIGIGRPQGKKDPADYVLEKFKKGERQDIDVVISEAADIAIDLAAEEG